MPDEAAVLKGSGTSEQQAYQEFYGRVPRSVEVEPTEEPNPIPDPDPDPNPDPDPDPNPDP